MSYWTNCNRCGSRIYMAKVQPPAEYSSRWLPFENELLNNCHIGCSPQNTKKTRKRANFVKCPICNVDVRKNRLAKHKVKMHYKNHLSKC